MTRSQGWSLLPCELPVSLTFSAGLTPSLDQLQALASVGSVVVPVMMSVGLNVRKVMASRPSRP